MLGRLLVVGALMVGSALGSAAAQEPKDGYKDVSMLQPPAGSKVAIVVFEDLGCPGCAVWHPVEHQVAAQEHVPLVRYDFPITAHVWTFQAAVNARYMEDTLHNAGLAEQYRSDVFKMQRQISGKDDLQQYTVRWLQQHGQQVPFVVDPTGSLAKRVKADYDLGVKMNLQFTPTVIVVTHEHYQVLAGLKDSANDPKLLAPAVEGALVQTRSAPAAKSAKK